MILERMTDGPGSVVRSVGEYLYAVLQAWVGVSLGIIGGAIDLFQKVGGHDVLPTQAVWAWMFAAFLIANVQAFHRMRAERDTYAPDKVAWDWSMEKALNYLREDTAASITLAGHSGWGLAYLSGLRQNARNSKVYVWGVLSPGTGNLNSTIERIKADYWRGYTFDLEACFNSDGDHSRTTPTFQGGTEIYEKLKFNSRQIKTV